MSERADPPADANSIADYLKLLPLPAAQRHMLSQRLEGDRSEHPAVARMARVHEAMAGEATQTHRDDPAAASVEQRLRLGLDIDGLDRAGTVSREPQGLPRISTMPGVNRTSVAPNRWPQGLWRNIVGTRGRANAKTGSEPPEEVPTSDPPHVDSRLHRAGVIRRTSLLGLTIAQTYLATDFMTTVLPYQGRQPLEIAILVLFALLFGWVSAGFWTAVAGFFLLLFGKDRYAISARAPGREPIAPAARTAVVMPICNEDVARVFAGLRATYESLERSGELRHFDFFVLSDSGDADVRVAESTAWLEMCRAVNGFGRVFYRWRRHRIKRKSGNVADFCRRWGRNYRYMVVLDADSVMTGECLTRLVRMMEASPAAGIIQTIPRAAGRDTLHARIQQFAANVYGPLFAAGLHFWQLGESHYWGHNAIIRVAPFMRHCALRRLPGRGVLSGEILSHDFVEAALMRRAGWGVWIAYDLPGSYEEMPPNLMDEIKRDRRWCQGNLMNFRLIAMEGVHTVHRAVFMTGVLAYVSAPLWFLALILSTALLAVHTLAEPVYFVQSYQLFPLWPEWRPERAVALFSTTLSLLFIPKILSVLIVLKDGARAFGGALRLALSVLGEMVVSALLAPIRMLFHTQFVTAALAGHSVQWKSPPREDAETSWSEAFRRHGWQTLLGTVWAGGVYWLNPAHVWWLLPVVGALMLSIPVSVYLSRAAFGRGLRRAGLFLVPEESLACPELRQTAALTRAASPRPGFVHAILDPVVNAQVCAMAPRRHSAGAIRHQYAMLVRHALLHGPDALGTREKMILLDDARALSLLHFQAWSSPEAAPAWREAIVSLQPAVVSLSPLQAAAMPRPVPTLVYRLMPAAIDARSCVDLQAAGSIGRATFQSAVFRRRASTVAGSPAPADRRSA